MNQYDILQGAFDLETHKQNFVNYLEVIITPDGTVEYAVPSHQEKLIKIATDKLSVSRQELYSMCPTEYLFDVVTWLCDITDCLSVWNDRYVGRPNKSQLAALRMLNDGGVYRGNTKEKDTE